MIESENPEWGDLAEPWFVDVSSDDHLHPLGVTRSTGLDSPVEVS